MSVDRQASGDRGQATVELALGLPFVVLLFLMLVQVGLVARERVLVTHAAREGVRAASLDPDETAITRAATVAGPLDPDRMRVTVDGRAGPGSRVTVRVTYRSPINLPLVGRVFADDLHAQATMRVER